MTVTASYQDYNLSISKRNETMSTYENKHKKYAEKLKKKRNWSKFSQEDRDIILTALKDKLKAKSNDYKREKINSLIDDIENSMSYVIV